MTSIFTKPPEALPVLCIEVTGAVTASNLVAYKTKAMTVIGEINRDLKTDQDFAEAENIVKWCADTESRLADEKSKVLAQTQSIEELFCMIDEISAETRRVRLELARLVKDRKDDIRGEIVAGGLLALDAHIELMNASMGKPYMPKVAADFGGAVKGKRTIDGLKAAVNAELDRAKGEADAIAKTITSNLAALRSTATDYKFLFADAAQIVLRPCGEVAELIKARIDKHQAAEEKKAEVLRESIRKEEQDKLAREQEAQAALAQRLADSEKQEQARQAEIAGAELQQRAAQESEVGQVVTISMDEKEMIGIAKLAFRKGWDFEALRYCDDLYGREEFADEVYELVIECQKIGSVAFDLKYAPQQAPADDGPAMTLGQIGERLGFALTASFLNGLGFAPLERDKKRPGAVLYRESSWPAIKATLRHHIASLPDLQAA